MAIDSSRCSRSSAGWPSSRCSRASVPALTLSEVANLTGITRATARRILLTLEKLGHVRSDGRLFSPTPRLLTLGWAYLSSLNLSELALPLMETLVEETHESCSAATLDLPDVVYVARVPTRRIMSITLSVGTRLPAHCTSMGRVLLAALAPDELDRYLAGAHARSVDRAHDDRSRPAARGARRDAPARLGARRPGARDRPALGGGAHPPRPGHDRGAQRVLGRLARVARRPAPAHPPAAGADGEHDLQRADPAGPGLPPHRQLSAAAAPATARARTSWSASVRSAYVCAHYEHDGQPAPQHRDRPGGRPGRRGRGGARARPRPGSGVHARDRAAPRARRSGGLRPAPRRRALVVPRALLRPDGGQRAVAGLVAAGRRGRGGARARRRAPVAQHRPRGLLAGRLHRRRAPRPPTGALRRGRDPHRAPSSAGRPTACRWARSAALPMFFGIAEGDDWISARRRPRHRRGLPARRRALRAARLSTTRSMG